MAVVGAGAVGLCVAYYAARAGANVCLIDRGTPGAGASWGNCGLITPGHSDPLTRPGALPVALRSLFDRHAPVRFAPTLDAGRIAWLLRFATYCTTRHERHARRARFPLLKRSRELIATLVRDERIDCEFSEQGLLEVFLSAGALARGARALQGVDQGGPSFEILSASEVQEREPALRNSVHGGIVTTDDAHLDPRRYTRGIAMAARRLGVALISDCEAVALKASSGAVNEIQTERGALRCEQVVICAGAQSKRLLRPLGIALPIEPAKGYSVTWPVPHAGLGRPVLFSERHVVATPWSDGWRLGSTVEFAGFDERMNRIRLARLYDAARVYLRAPVQPEGGREWFGFRPMSVDELPFLGASSRVANLFFACGHGTLGITESAGSGQLLAELLTGRPPSIDPTPFAPGRFRC